MATPLKVEFGWIDGSGERTRSQLYIALDTAATVNAHLVDANLLRVALEAVTDLNETKVTGLLPIHSAPPTLPASVWAQREHGIRVSYADTVTGRVYHFDLPGVDETAIRVAGTDAVNMTVGMIAFKDAIELTAVSLDGNPIAVQGMRFYGKNN